MCVNMKSKQTKEKKDERKGRETHINNYELLWNFSRVKYDEETTNDC